MQVSSSIFIDVGHSTVKYQLAGDEQIYKQSYDAFDIKKMPSAKCAYLACVVRDSIVCLQLQQHYKQCFLANSQPVYQTLRNGYDKASALGVDRWLSLVATYHDYPKKNALIIDVGSAVTMDILLADGQHQGGWIMPGFKWLKNTMSAFNGTDVISDVINDEPARNTELAWHNGCRFMLCDTINTRVKTLQSKYKNLNVVLTGGGVPFLSSLTFSCEHNVNLVLSGLKYWAENKDKQSHE